MAGKTKSRLILKPAFHKFEKKMNLTIQCGTFPLLTVVEDRAPTSRSDNDVHDLSQ